MIPKTFFIFSLMCSLLCGNVYGQTTQYREEFHMVGEDLDVLDHITSMDGGTMLMTTTFTWVPPYTYVTLIKLDSSGTLQWQKRFGPVDVRANKIVQTPDSGYFFTAMDWANDNKSIYTRVDKNGNVIFSRTYSLPPLFYQTSYGGLALAKNDGGFYVSSTVQDLSANNANGWQLLELDNQGNVVWAKIYFGGNSASYALDTTANGDIVVTGSMVEPITYKEFSAVLRTDTSGGIRWYKCYKSPNKDVRGMAADIDDNDNIYVTAPWDASASSNNTTFLMKVDSAGNPIWSNRYMINTGIMPNFVRVTSNNEVVVGGHQCLMKLDSAGQSICARKHQQVDVSGFDMLTDQKYSYSGTWWMTGRILFYTSDDCGKTCVDSAMSYSIVPISIYDSTLSGSAPLNVTSSAYSMPTDTVTIYSQVLCTIVSVPELPFIRPEIDIYPSPANDNVHIVSPTVMSAVRMINYSGQTVGNFESGSDEMDIDVSHFPAGIYFLQVVNATGTIHTKFVVVHD